MDGRLFVSTFFAVLLAELGDKTQVATLTLSAAHRAPWTLFAASALALVLSSGVAVLAGGFLARWISPVWLARVAGAILIVLGAWTLWNAGRGG
jgi:putative Ca2+/H+ antiporter (TMEM165/GDT1 family)